MKIILLIDARAPGGVETHVLNLCKGLRASGHDCWIVFVRDYPNNMLYDMCHHQHIPFETPKNYHELISYLLREKPDMIHTHGYKANILGRLVGLISRSKIISTFHSGEKPVGRLILYNVLDRWSSFLSRNLAVTSTIAAKIPGHCEVIPNFIHVPATPNALKLQGPYHIYYIGRFSPEKGPDRFCELSTLLPHDQFKLHMTGAGPLLDSCKKKYQQHIQFHGAISNMDDIWPNVDLLCITSTYEGLPLVLLEAMARGIPVVAFDVGDIKNTMSDETCVIKSFDLQQMAHCIIKHFEHSIDTRQAMATKAREKMISNYSAEAVIPRILKFYKNCTING